MTINLYFPAEYWPKEFYPLDYWPAVTTEVIVVTPQGRLFVPGMEALYYSVPADLRTLVAKVVNTATEVMAEAGIFSRPAEVRMFEMPYNQPVYSPGAENGVLTVQPDLRIPAVDPESRVNKELAEARDAYVGSESRIHTREED